MLAQGNPRTRFKRAIEGRWLFHAEIAAHEMGNLTLDAEATARLGQLSLERGA